MATNGVLGTQNLLAGVPQAIYTCNNDQATVLTLNVVNRSNGPAKIRVSIGAAATVQNPAEFLEFETELAPKGVLERTGLIVSPGYYLIVKSDVAPCNAVCYGIEVGAQAYFNTISQYGGTTPAWVTPAGSLGTLTAGAPTLPETLSVVATDANASQLKYSVASGSLPAGTALDADGTIRSIATTTGYTSGTTGQTTSFDIAASNGTNSAVRSFSITKKWYDGSTSALAALSGRFLYEQIGAAYLPSGTYWINVNGVPNQYYVDMLTGAMTWYNEGTDCRSGISNWNDQQVYNMTTTADLGNCWIHGWGGSARTYTVNLSNLPAHRYLRMTANIHMVDSWDNEYNSINVNDSLDNQFEIINWRKILSGVPNSVNINTAIAPTTAVYKDTQIYSYRPWGNGGSGHDGYYTISTGLYSHNRSNFRANFYTGLDQAATDEAYYISHFKVEILT